jgi:hypothetical protein
VGEEREVEERRGKWRRGEGSGGEEREVEERRGKWRRGEGSAGEEREGKETDGCPLTEREKEI